MHETSPPVTAGMLAEALGPRALATSGDLDVEVVGFAALIPGRRGHVSFVTAAAGPEMLGASRSQAFLVPADTPDLTDGSDRALIHVAAPRLEFARLAHRFFPDTSALHLEGVHPSVTLGEGTVVAASAVLEPGVVIGQRCVIGPNVVIRRRCRIGDDVTIAAGTSIGNPGYGFARDETGAPIRLPHYAAVTIGDRVEIASNVVIDRGVFSDTLIGDDVKIDSFVLVGHNCAVGDGALLIGGAILCGGVKVGERAWIAPGTTVMEKLTVGDDAVVGIGATVMKSVRDGMGVMGSPARPILGTRE